MSRIKRLVLAAVIVFLAGGMTAAFAPTWVFLAVIVTAACWGAWISRDRQHGSR